MKDLNEKCAVVGVYDPSGESARKAYFGLFALQHRGQEASGISSYDKNFEIISHKDSGLVGHVYDEKAIEKLAGNFSIGHNRYSTSHGIGPEHAQPVLCENIALGHNGNIPSVIDLQKFLKDSGIDAEGMSDSEMIASAVSFEMKNGAGFVEAFKKIVPLLHGSYSLVILADKKLYAIRDPFGIRPLCLGKLKSGGYAIASETCAFPPMGAEFLRAVCPGEIIEIDENGMNEIKFAEPTPKIDAFEFVYFARYDSIIAGKSVYEARLRAGSELAKEYKGKVDIVVPVPETAISAALGFSQASGVPMHFALSKNRYIHRTFIEPRQEDREMKIKMKLSVIPSVVAGKSVALVDDSIVRGNTSRQIVDMLLEAGAKEVHFLVASPQVKFPDFYGIDTPKQDSLIAASHDVEGIREAIHATALHFLSLDGLVRAIDIPKDQLCLSCFNGEYPIDILERKNEVNYDVPKE